MKITRVTAKPVEVPLVKPFVVAIGKIRSCAVVFVRIETDAGITGYGEGAATPFVTGETNDTVLSAVNFLTPALIGQSPFAIGQLHRAMDAALVGNGSAKAAIDIALYDIMAKAAGLPLYEFLGAPSGKVETDMTIGISDPASMASDAAKLAARGYRHIKVKAGMDEERDIEAIKLIREAAPMAALKLDANQGWGASQALRMLRKYKKYGIEAVEQPVPYWDIDGLAEVRARSPVPVMADESCFTPHDAVRIIKKSAADMINIKLMKCGGLYRAAQICAIAEAAGVPCMLGCMMESRVAIAAAAAFVAAKANVVYADLDSFAEFDDSSFVKGGFEFKAPVIQLPDTPGIGVELIF
jgi:L-alanine-DL-glutamate epimerase-like enolase superfamily enzyme